MTKSKHTRNEVNIEDSDDSSSDYTPSPRPSRRQITNSVRRHSRLLYLEKYGLNQPGWYSSDNLNDYENDSSDDELNEEIEEQRKKIEQYKAQLPTTPTNKDTESVNETSLKRPVSIRNYAQITSTQKRPPKFVKPINSASSIGKVALPPTEFVKVHKLLESYEKKIYIEGYLQKKNDLKSNGSSCAVKKWSVWYVELCGPVLSLWDASELSSTSNDDIFPQYINITDSTVNIEQDSPLNIFSLNSAGANRYVLQAPDPESLRRWVSAIRLSCFECSRIQEIYTRAFITRPQYTKCLTNHKKSRLGQAGFLHVRFPNATGWKQYWVVVSNQKKQKSLFSRKTVSFSGRIMFFESKKAKHPVMTIQNVVQAYTVYPESPKLINAATLFKIEGSLYKNGYGNNDLQLINASSSALLMTSSTIELVEWLVHIFDAFQLYGLPTSLLSDPCNPKSLDFGDVATYKLKQRLFLELEEISQVSIEDALLSNKAEFNALLAQKLKHGLSSLKTLSEKSITSENHDSLLSPVASTKALTCGDVMSEKEEDSDDDSIPKPYTKSSHVKSTNKTSISALDPVPNFNENDLCNPALFNSTPKSTTQQRPHPIKTVESSRSRSIKSSDSETSSSIHTDESSQMRKSLSPVQRSESSASSKSPVYSPGTPIISPIWPMNHSTTSVIHPDLSTFSHTDSSSVNTRMMPGSHAPFFCSTDTLQQRHSQMGHLPSLSSFNHRTEEIEEEEDEDDDTPIADTFPTRRASIQVDTLAGRIEGHTGSNSPQFSMMSGYGSPTLLVNLIDEKKKQEGEKDRVDDQSMAWNRMMMEQRQQQITMQQYMQQYNLMPVMMPVMDPRLLSQPVMMIDPRFMNSTPVMSPTDSKVNDYSDQLKEQDFIKKTISSTEDSFVAET
ncbi:hypothetical protein G6F35_005207 [Rhizopus arrhizus]|nr:hypothetical protein G6F35_005207 [Rhizopus arrhizus]